MGEHRFGAREANQLRILVERNAHGARLLGKCLEHRLTNPPHGVRDELDALVGIELPDRLQEPLVPDRDKLAQIEAVPLVLLHVGDDESQVRGDEPLRSLDIALLCLSRESPFFFGAFYQWKLLYVLEVLVKCSGGGRTEITLGPGLGRLLHTRPLPVPEGGRASSAAQSRAPA